jgi:hypothetical protein
MIAGRSIAAEESATPKRAPGLHAASEGAALRLVVDGLEPDERDVLAAILHILEERCARRWQLCDRAPADLQLHTRAALRDHRAGVTGLILREGETAGSGDSLDLTMPLRVMAVLDVLNAAGDRLSHRRILSEQQAPATPAAGVEDDGKSLATALGRLIERKPDQALRVRIVGHGTLYVSWRQRRFCSDFARDKLKPALEQHSFVLTTIASDSPELEQQMQQARPIDELLWSIGLSTGGEPPALCSARFRLQRWPDLARLPHKPMHIQACAALAARAMSADELAAAVGVSRRDACHFLHACELCGLTQTLPADTQAAPSVLPASGRFTGLFDRLRRSLGL